MRVPVSIRTRYFMANKKALVDSGATDNFIHPAFAKWLGLAMTPLEKPKKIYNIDNTSNKSGSITHSLELKVTTKGIEKVMRFLVTDIGNEDILLRYPWLATFEPKFGWKDTIIETRALPIIITSTLPVDTRMVIAGLQTEDEKEQNTAGIRRNHHYQRNSHRVGNPSRRGQEESQNTSGLRSLQMTVQ